MQRSFIHILSIGSLWDSGSFFKIHPMPTAQNINPETHLSAIIHFRLLTEQYEVFGRYSTLCLHLKPKLTSDLLGEGKGCHPPAMRGFPMKYDRIVFPLNNNLVQLKACFFLAWGSSLQQHNGGFCSAYPAPNRDFWCFTTQDASRSKISLAKHIIG